MKDWLKPILGTKLTSGPSSEEDELAKFLNFIIVSRQ